MRRHDKPNLEAAIRPGGDGDMAMVRDIYAHHVLHGTASFEIEPPDEAEIRRRMAHVLRLGMPYLVADLAGEVVGYAYAGPYRERPAYRWTVENSVYVRAGREGRGIGRMLLQALIRDCEARGFRQMIAVIGDGAAASVALHAALGFRTIGILRSVGFKFGRWMDVVQMQRALGQGDGTVPSPR